MCNALARFVDFTFTFAPRQMLCFALSRGGLTRFTFHCTNSLFATSFLSLSFFHTATSVSYAMATPPDVSADKSLVSQFNNMAVEVSLLCLFVALLILLC